MSKIKAWWQQRPPGIGAVALLCIGVLLGIITAEWIAAPHKKMIPVKFSNGQTIYMTPEDAKSEAITTESFPDDFTKVKNPDEPKLPPIPSMSRSK
jgi:hypothetical protein